MGLVGMEPALQGARTDAEVFGDLAMPPPAGDHEQGLAAIAQTSVWSRIEGVF
jgi:hypothetical protein